MAGEIKNKLDEVTRLLKEAIAEAQASGQSIRWNPELSVSTGQPSYYDRNEGYRSIDDIIDIDDYVDHFTDSHYPEDLEDSDHPNWPLTDSGDDLIYFLSYSENKGLSDSELERWEKFKLNLEKFLDNRSVELVKSGNIVSIDLGLNIQANGLVELSDYWRTSNYC